MRLRILAIILICTGLLKAEPSSDTIKETQEKIAQINIAFLKGQSPGSSAVDELGKLLDIINQKKNFSKADSTALDYENGNEKLIVVFKKFEVFYRGNPESDTLKTIFRFVNNEFNSLFGDYLLTELKKSTKNRIIIFSTSMSCECTLEMCYKQESEIQLLHKEYPDLFDYTVVDCFINSGLQDEYEVGFIPTVALFDQYNKKVKSFVREEDLSGKLLNLLKP
jgi:uncharacterized protein YfkK (UPF0435 family)